MLTKLIHCLPNFNLILSGLATEIYQFTLMDTQKILADSRGFGYFHLVIPINLIIVMKS
jgi:hypothetical protein